MGSAYIFKVWGIALVLGALVSTVVTFSLQVVRNIETNNAEWKTSDGFVKDQAYFSKIEQLFTQVKSDRVLSKYLYQQKNSNETSETDGNASVQLGPGVTLPGGEKLLGIISNNNSSYALISPDKKDTFNTNLIEVYLGEALPSGYKLIRLNPSSIVVKYQTEDSITIELYK